tara:strand:+ start:58 stop:231 length:174 start_codon:yes stop_codon:yes gene_type:complete
MPPVKAYRTIEFLPIASARMLPILAEDLDLFHRADTPQNAFALLRGGLEPLVPSKRQ